MTPARSNLAAALAAVPVVHLPEGDYDIGTSPLVVPAGRRIVGPGRIHGAVPSNAVLWLNEGAVLDGVTVENTDTTSGNIAAGLSARAVDVSVTHCRFLGSSRTQAVQVSADGIDGLLISACSFDGVNYGVLVNDPGDRAMRDIRIIGNRFDNIYGDGVELNSPSSGQGAGGITDVIVADNYIRAPFGLGAGVHAGFGVGIAGGSHITVTGNIIKDCRYQGIHIEDQAHNIAIVANIIRDTGRSGSLPDNGFNDGIHVIDGDGLTITGNVVTGSADHGINCEYAPGNQATRVAISGNTVQGSGLDGIKVAGQVAIHGAVAGNVSTDNGGYGLAVVGSGGGVTRSGNVCAGNALGDTNDPTA